MTVKLISAFLIFSFILVLQSFLTQREKKKAMQKKQIDNNQ